MKTEVTFLGLVRQVVGANIFVEISPELSDVSPIIHGRVYRIGQVGTFVKIPLGSNHLYGVISKVGASEILHPEETTVPYPHGQRWIEVQLVGETYGHEGFQRGVSIFPTIDDEVHIVTEEDLAIIYGTVGPSMVEIGTHAVSEGLPASLDLDKIVTRHAAVVGSTGSGKSNTVAGLLKTLTEGSYPNAHIVVIDPHGEYDVALKDRARVFAIGDKDNPLFIPYWALSFDELAWFLVDRRSATYALQDLKLQEYILEQKRNRCHEIKAGGIDPNSATIDSPIPFSIRNLWYHFDRLERITYQDQDRTIEALDKEGDPRTLTSAIFRPAGPGMTPPFNPKITPNMGAYVNKIYAHLKDNKFDFLLNPDKCDGSQKDLHDLLTEWIGHEHSITVLDLGGVPFETIDLVVGAITRLLFENMFWGRDLPGIGRQRPLLLVYEEAHSYLPKGEGTQFIAGYALKAVKRVFKEGRKYGVGAIVVSQRPSELNETILSQCGTFFALRLTNTDDRGRIRSAAPDELAGLIEVLPALRTGEALVLGEAVKIPSRIRFPLIEPRPRSYDSEPAKRWKENRVKNPPYDKAVTRWRQQSR